MGKARLMGNNFITADTSMRLTSWATGIVTRAQKEGAGSAIASTEGDYDGRGDTYLRLIQDDVPISYWRLDDASGNAIDLMGAHNATAVGTLTYSATGLLPNTDNAAVEWTGLGGYFEAADHADWEDQSISIECWIQAGTVGGHVLSRWVQGGATVWRLYLDATGALNFETSSAGSGGADNFLTTPAATIVAGGTYHVVVTHSGSATIIYVNGVSVATGGAMGYSVATTAPLRIGDAGVLPLPYYDGIIDEVAFYNYVLTPAEVLAHYSAGVSVIDRDYLVQIDAAGTGEVASATYLWSDDGGAHLNDALVPTSTVPTLLNSGVKISWAGGAGADFVLGDLWRFKGVLPYGPVKMTDLDRDTEFRSGAASVGNVACVWDLGSAQVPTCFIILDHNFTAAAQIRLEASVSPTFSSIDLSYAIPYRTPHLLRFIDEGFSYQYWRINVYDIANPDGYLAWSTAYLGTFTELTRTFELGDVRSYIRLADREQSPAGRFFGGLNALIQVFTLEFAMLDADDRDALVAVYSLLADTTNRRVKPVFFAPDADDLTDVHLCEWEGALDGASLGDAPERFRVAVRLIEIPRTT